MRINENYLGKNKTFGFSPSFDTKFFFQEVIITNPNTRVKLIHIFNKNEDIKYPIEMEGFSQFIDVNWGDDNRTRLSNDEIINSGRYNKNGIIIEHTFKSPGTYIIEIESVEDLIAVDYEYDYDNNIDKNPCEIITLETKRIGGKLNIYIPPKTQLLNGFESLLDSKIDEIFNSGKNNYDSISIYKEKTCLIPSSWLLTVDKLEGFIDEITFKYDLTTDYSCFFSRWFSSIDKDISETIIDHLYSTLYNLFKKKNYGLTMKGFFAHTKNIHKIHYNGNISKFIREFIFDFNDYSIENTEIFFKDLSFMFWDSKITNTSEKWDLFTENLSYTGINKSLKRYPKMIKGMYGLLSREQELTKGFDFRILTYDTYLRIFNTEDYVIDNEFDMSYFMYGSPTLLVPVYNLLGYKFFNPEAISYNINMKRAFMFSKGVNINIETLENINFISGVNVFSFIPIPNINKTLEGRINITLDTSDIFLEFDNNSILKNIKKTYNLEGFSNIVITMFENRYDNTNNPESNKNCYLNMENFMFSYGKDIDLLFSYEGIGDSIGIKWYSSNLNNDIINIDYNVSVVQNYKKMFKNNNSENRLISLDTRTLELYIDTKVNLNAKFTNNIDYTEILMNSNIKERNTYIDLFQPVGYKFYESIPENIRDNYDENNFEGIVICDGMFKNCDWDTKEIGQDFLLSSDKFTITNSEKLINDLNCSSYISNVMKIKSAIMMFGNETDRLIKSYSKVPITESIRNRNTYKQNKKVLMNNMYGFEVDERVFTDKNYTEEANLEKMFFNNIGLDINYIYQINKVFRIDVSKYTLIDFMGIDDTLKLNIDVESNYKYSEFQLGWKVSDGNDTFIKSTSRHAYLFDHFRIFDFNNIDINTLGSIEISLESEKINNMFRNRLISTFLFKYVMQFKESYTEDYKFIINSKEYDYGQLHPRMNTIMNTKMMEIIDKKLGIEYNLSNPNDYLKNLLKNINLTRNYFHIIHQPTNINSNRTIGIYFKILTNISLLFKNDESTDLYNNFGTNLFDNKRGVFLAKVDNKKYRKIYSFNSNSPNDVIGMDFEVLNDTDNWNDKSIIESRIYLKSRVEDITDYYRVITYPIDKVNKNSKEISNVFVTSLNGGDDEWLSLIDTLDNIKLLNFFEFEYLSPHTSYIINKVIRTESLTTIYLNLSNSYSKYNGYRDFLDLLYDSDYMNDLNKKKLIAEETNSYLEFVRDNDFKCISYFNIVKDVDFGGLNLKAIIGNGIIHHDIPLSNARFSKIKEIDGLCSRTYKDNLKFISGTLVNSYESFFGDNFDDYVNLSKEKILLYNIFRNTNEKVIDLDFLNPYFLHGFSFINLHNNKLSIISGLHWFRGFNPKNKFAFAGIIQSNIFNELNFVFERAYLSSNFIMPKSLDELWIDDIIIRKYNLNGTFETITTPSLSLNEFKGILPLIENINGTRVQDIIINIIKSEDSDSYHNLKIKNIFNIDNTLLDKVKYIDPLLFKIENHNNKILKVDSFYLSGGLPYIVSSNYIKELYLNLFSNIEITSTDSSNRTNTFESIDYFMNMFIFNNGSDKSIDENTLNKLIFRDGNSYGFFVDGFTINKHCNVTYKINNETKTINNYIMNTYIKIQELENNQAINFLKSINISNIRDENPDDMLFISLKWSMEKSLYVRNSDLFNPRIFIKDNANEFFEMQRMWFKRDPNIETEGDYWHINIAKSELTRNVSNLNVSSNRIYQGKNIFTDNIFKFKYSVDANYLNQNSMVFDIPKTQDTFILYVINDTPFSIENSGGYVYKLEGPICFNIMNYIENIDGVYDLEYLMRTTCNTNYIEELDPDIFKYCYRSETTPFKIKFGNFNIKNINLNLLNGFGENLIGIIDSFNGENESCLSGFISNNLKNFSIINSFNFKTNLVGLKVLSPFNRVTIKEISNSFNLKEDSKNKIIPYSILDSNTSGSFKIHGSFNNGFIIYPLRTRTIDFIKVMNIDYSSCFNKVLNKIKEYYGDYTVNYLLNYKYNKIENSIIDGESTYDELKSHLTSMKQFISNEYYNKEDVVPLEGSYVNKKMEVNIGG